MPRRHRAVLPLALAHAIALFAWGALRHAAYGSRAYDLGAYHQVFYNLSRGSAFNEIEQFHQWSAHLEIGLVWLALPYRLAPSPLWLLAAQAAACAAAALPVDRLARRVTGDAAIGLFAAAATLLTPQLLFAEHYDFHSITLCALPVAWIALAIEEDRALLLIAWLLVATSIREQMALLAPSAAIALLLRHGATRRRATFAGAAAALGLAVFALEVLVVIPSFNEAGTTGFRYAKHYRRLGESPREIVRFALTRPLTTLRLALEGGRAAYLLELACGGVLPVLFGAVYSYRRSGRVTELLGALRLSLWPLVVATPMLAIQLLSAHPPTFSIHFQYGAPLVPLVAASAIHGAAQIERARGGGARLGVRAWLAAQAIASLLLFVPEAWDRGGPLDLSFHLSPRAPALARATAAVPVGAHVSAQDAATPHLTGRVRRWPEDADRAAYVLLDERGDPLASPEAIRAAASALRGARGGRVLVDEAGVLLVSRADAPD